MAATLEQRLSDEFASLSPKLQRAARYVLDNPDDVALMSMRALADAAGVHPSTMMRLARTFDCDGFADFRLPFQNRFSAQPRTSLSLARDLQARGGKDKHAVLVREMMAQGSRNLTQTFDRSGPEKLEACAKDLLAADRIFIMGARSAFSVAFYLEYAIKMFRENVTLLGGRGGTYGDSLRALRPGDVTIAISFDPYAHDTVRAISYAKDHGAQTVVLTDGVTSPLVADADHLLLFKNDSPAVFNSVSSVMALAEALVALMTSAGGDDALKAIENSEKQLTRFDAYWRRQEEPLL